MSSARSRPIIGIPSSTMLLPEHSIPQHLVGERYIRSTMNGAGVLPFVIPALADEYDFAELAASIDGLMLTGGRANIEPHHYGGPPFPDDELRDPARDATVLPLVRACVEGGVPVFGVCRGIQEINVALGGTLHYRVHELPGKMDHRMVREGSLDERFGPRHPVAIAPGGLFASLVDEREVTVNSLHGQGIDRVADGLVIEALAPDGLVEGVRLDGAKAFTVGVQWHAEWRCEDHPLSCALFRRFGEAAEARAVARGRLQVT